jgi:hypothetical protein
MGSARTPRDRFRGQENAGCNVRRIATLGMGKPAATRLHATIPTMSENQVVYLPL